MSDLDATTPRVFLARHGETEWTINGRFTGVTDLELTELGAKQVESTGDHLVGPGKLIDPNRVVKIWVSPRKRAQQTFELLFKNGTKQADNPSVNDKVVITEDIAEWDYGDYEGLKAEEIRELRKEKGFDQVRKFDIWQDGCENGESPEQVSERLDRLISQIREIQRPHMDGETAADIVLVAHGLILRAFFKRWLRLKIEDPLPMIFSAGAVAILGYKNHNIDEPGFFVGMAVPFQE